jgi:hypothetical protein
LRNKVQKKTWLDSIYRLKEKWTKQLSNRLNTIQKYGDPKSAIPQYVLFFCTSVL